MSATKRFWRQLTGPSLLLWLCACTLVPAERFEQQAQELGFERVLLAGDGFEHAVYMHAPDAATRGSLLHVYLDGDGSPWLAGRWVAADPTPAPSLTLKLMALDPAPRLYLGRPCYHGLATHPQCNESLWTDARYSQRVVDSMSRALGTLLLQRHSNGLVLIGHSGGGTLAMLLAERLPQTRGLVTVGANLDPDRWTTLHGYRPLTASLNPATRPPLSAGIYQLHLTGGRDRTVPADLVTGVLVAQPGAEHWHFPQYDHRCCWSEIWPALLEHLAERIKTD
ncbi:alpha/beta fold hydrolase [Marinobacterium rhizophilum]|uniref:alpha/beta fold hydrolase n=1 Tax=Marinobacterium rhizophilum TaxID=420402 RepID=UPI00036325B3|nr:alpha/beta hydrolase [Marinobacterium rhizophilum]